jgi:protein tyrosine phosphatase (PTP) superfamily phosphohydrolase (DUF442 family)
MLAGLNVARAAKSLQRVRRAALGWREPLIEGCPSPVQRLLGPVGRWLDMLLVDHGVFRLFYLNRHRLGARAWRSAQPAPHQIRAMARQGVRTVINLRGERKCGSYWLEKAACRRRGIEMIDFKLHSRSAPSRECLRTAVELLHRIEYPMLLHCKSGADRAGLMSVIYRHTVEGVPMAVAIGELSWRYGHFRRSPTGILDAVFERYLTDTRAEPMAFLDWVENRYDPVALRVAFGQRGRARPTHDPVWAERPN